MLSLGRHDLIPLPTLPLWQETRPAGIALRRFGATEDDLGVDFSSPDRAALATHILNICSSELERVPEGFYKDLSIGKRIEILLLLAFGGHDASLSLLFKCSSCGEDLEIELELSEISRLQSASDELQTLPIRLDGSPVSFRKPTGRDQETWVAAIQANDESDARREMIGILAVEPELLKNLKPDSYLEIENALDEADPLVNFSCVLTCEVCGLQDEYDVDLFETALSKLRSAQNELLLMVHRVASRYHWSEREIFAVPHSRRLRYLKLIGEGDR